MKILNSELVILSNYQNLKTIFAKGFLPNWSEEVLWLKKLKALCCGYVTSDLKGK